VKVTVAVFSSVKSLPSATLPSVAPLTVSRSPDPPSAIETVTDFVPLPSQPETIEPGFGGRLNSKLTGLAPTKAAYSPGKGCSPACQGPGG
jgi:hypothetical protein